MKNKGLLVLLGVGAAFGVYEVIRAKETGAALEIDPVDVSDIRFGGGSAMSGNVNLKVTNPMAGSLTVQYLNLHAILSTNGKTQELATMNNKAVSQNFPGLSSTIWKIPFTVDIATVAQILGADILSLLSGKFKLPDSILLQGSVNAAGFNIPYDKTIPLTTGGTSGKSVQTTPPEKKVAPAPDATKPQPVA